MKKALIIVSLVLLVALCTGKSEEYSYQRMNLTKFKGVWPAPGETKDLLAHAENLKELGINMIAISVPYCVNGREIRQELWGPPVFGKTIDDALIELIDEAHKKGFAVFLELNTLGPNCEFIIEDKDYFINNFINESKRWAKIAEEHQVELFSPLNEPNLVLMGNEFEWAKKVLPEVRKVFKGDVAIKMADKGPEKGNYSGYDYVGFDMYPHDLSKWRKNLNDAVIKMNSIIRNYSLTGGFFGELGASTKRENSQLFAGVVVNESEQAEVFKTAFEVAWNETKGFIIMTLSYSNPDATYNFHGLEAENVIRKWFNK